VGWLSTNWRRRAAITVDNSAGTASPIDAQGSIPKDWDDFWGIIDASGNECRITAADGVTAVSYDIDKSGGGAFDKTNRDGRISIDATTAIPSGAAMVLFWIYFDSVSAAGDGSSVVAIASAKSLYIERSRPMGRVIPYEPQVPGSQRPKVTIHKQADEQVKVWIAIGHALHKRWTPGQGISSKHEEVWWTITRVDDTSGTDQAATLADQTLARFVEHGQRMFIVHHVKAGTSATNYTIRPSIYTLLPYETTANQRLIASIGLSVRDTRILT